MKIRARVTTKKGNEFEVSLPAKRIVCPDCDGKGTELYGGLKGACISEENLADPDFCEAYFGGEYDVPCSHCKGRNVVDVVDIESLTPKMLDRYCRAEEEEARFRAEERAEQRRFSHGEY